MCHFLYGPNSICRKVYALTMAALVFIVGLYEKGEILRDATLNAMT
jgi:hypothetical protein